MSERVHLPLKTSSPVPSIKPVPFGVLQRKCACGGSGSSGGECEECRKKEMTLQRRASGNSAPNTVPPIVYDVLRSPGQPLDATTRAFFEPRFGHDFSKVRMHTDEPAAESALSVNALAYSVGHHIVFDRRQYAPGTVTGRHLLAHELAHVVQQQAATGPIAPRFLALGAAHDVAEHQADLAADAVTQFPMGPAPLNLGRSGPVLRRMIRTNEPAGGCALCRTAAVAGTFAHGIVQREFRKRYGKNIIPEASYPNPNDKENGRLDLLRVDRTHTPALVEIGEIKPDNDRGVRAGKSDLDFYKRQLAQHFRGPEFAIQFLDIAPPGPVSVTLAPPCPAQTLSVRAARIGGPPGLYLFKCEPPARQIGAGCCKNQSTGGQGNQMGQPTSQTQGNAAAQRHSAALHAVGDMISRLSNRINQSEGEHRKQRDLIFKPSAVGFVGFWTNRIFNTDPPDMTIWTNADIYVGAAKRAWQRDKLGEAYANLLRARHYYLAALKQYLIWKDGIEGAATKMKVTIGVSAALAVTAFVAPTVIAALAEEAPAAASSGEAAQQMSVRIASTLANADRVMEAADAISTEQEIEAEAQLEAEMTLWQ